MCVTSDALITSTISRDVNSARSRFPSPKMTLTRRKNMSSPRRAFNNCSETLAPATPNSLLPDTDLAFLTADTTPSDINVKGVVPSGIVSGTLCVTTNTGTPLLGWLPPHPLTMSYVPRPTIMAPASIKDLSCTNRFASESLKNAFTLLTWSPENNQLCKTSAFSPKGCLELSCGPAMNPSSEIDISITTFPMQRTPF